MQARGWKIQGSWLVPGKGLDIHLFYKNVQTGSEVHPASYSMGTVGSLPAGKTAGECSTHLTSISAKVKDALSYNVTLAYAFRAPTSLRDMTTGYEITSWLNGL